MTPHALKTLLASPIAFHRVFAAITGGALPGLFLSQVFYWSNRTTDAEGWFYKSREEWAEETAMTRYEQETARKILGEGENGLGVLQEMQRGGTDRRVYYRVNVDRLSELVEAACKTNQSNSGKVTVPLVGKPPMERRKNSQSNGRKVTVPLTETTTETTSKNTNIKASPAKTSVDDTNVNDSASFCSQSFIDEEDTNAPEEEEENADAGRNLYSPPPVPAPSPAVAAYVVPTKPPIFKPEGFDNSGQVKLPGRASVKPAQYAAAKELVERFYDVVPPKGITPPDFVKKQISAHFEQLLGAIEKDITPDKLEKATERARIVYLPPKQVTLPSVLGNVFELLKEPVSAAPKSPPRRRVREFRDD